MKKINWDYLLTLIFKKGLLVWSIYHACSISTDTLGILTFVIGMNVSMNVMLHLFSIMERN